METLPENGGSLGAQVKIYNEIKAIRGEDNLTKTFDATIRRELQQYNSDSPETVFLGKEDLFYMPDGVGKGVWALRPDLEPGKKKVRNPDWTRDELILALNCYISNFPKIPGKTSKEVIELSGTLNKLSQVLSSDTSVTFRNENGVYMKMMNFHANNPQHQNAGLRSGGKLDQLIFDEFYQRPKELKKVAEAITLLVENEGFVIEARSQDETEGEDAQEGRILTRIHKYRERDPKIVKKKKEDVLRTTGKLVCECCSFDFLKTYGERGEGYIECHHINPVSEIIPGQKTLLNDLALICANCHRMIHRFRPWLTIEELKSIISK